MYDFKVESSNSGHIELNLNSYNDLHHIFFFKKLNSPHFKASLKDQKEDEEQFLMSKKCTVATSLYCDKMAKIDVYLTCLLGETSNSCLKHFSTHFVLYCTSNIE